MNVKLGFVDGSILKLENGDLNLINSWARNNNIVMSWILISISKDIAANLLYLNTAHEIWNDLKELFKQSNGSKIFQLHLELLRTRQDQLTVNQYFLKLKTISKELNNLRPMCTCGGCSCGRIRDLDIHH